MSLSNKASSKMSQHNIDSEFINLINALNESISEFYGVAKYNNKEINTFLNQLDPKFNSIFTFLNEISNLNPEENIGKILDDITQCKNIISQLKNNTDLNLNNLKLFFDDAKILFKRMKEKRSENLKIIKHSATVTKSNSNKINPNSIANLNSQNAPLIDVNKIKYYIMQLRKYNDIIGNFSEPEKLNFINLQKMMLKILSVKRERTPSEGFMNSEVVERNNLILEKDNNRNYLLTDTDSNYKNQIIEDKAKKHDELNDKIEKEIILGNCGDIKLLKDKDLEKRIMSLINYNKNLIAEIKQLKNDFNKLDNNNIQLKQNILSKDRELMLLQKNINNNNNINYDEYVIQLKNNNINLTKENNILKQKLKMMNERLNNNNLNQNLKDNSYSIRSISANESDTLNKKIKELSKLLNSKMQKIISLEKENIDLKCLIEGTGVENRSLRLRNAPMNNPNQIKRKSINNNNNNLKISLEKLIRENQNLKEQLKALELRDDYVNNMKQELEQLRKIIEEENINNNSKNVEYEQKINNLQSLLNDKEALLNQYELQMNDNLDSNNTPKEITNKNKIISELKRKIDNYEKQLYNVANNSNQINQLKNLINKLQNENQILKKQKEIIAGDNSEESNNLKKTLIEIEKENMQYKLKLEEMTKIKNLYEISKKEKETLQNEYKELISQNAITNQKNTELLQKLNSDKDNGNENVSSIIQKKEEEIEGLQTFIQKLTKDLEKGKEDLEDSKLKVNLLQKENQSIKNQLERLSIEMPKELNALKRQLDEANKKLSGGNNLKDNLKQNHSSNVIKSSKIDDDNIVGKLNQEIAELKNKNKELLFKLEDKELNQQNSRYKTEDLNMSGYEEEFDLRKMATGARDKNRSEDINIDYPGIQNYKEKLKEIQFRLSNLEEQVKILLSKVKCNSTIKPTFVQICQLLGYSSTVIEKMANSEKEKKKILGV